jgi:hypothetical protein
MRAWVSANDAADECSSIDVRRGPDHPPRTRRRAAAHRSDTRCSTWRVRDATYILRKTQSPAITAQELPPIVVVLLSHDHHFDNLDRAGRRLLGDASVVVTTVAGAGRLGERSLGLAPWDTHDVHTTDGPGVRITATPARHGPEAGDRGPVIGFVLTVPYSSDPVVYVTGDTVWFDGVAEVADRMHPDVVGLFGRAARVSDASATVSASAEGDADLRNQVTTLDVVLDLRPLSDGTYEIAVCQRGEDWQLFPVQIN